MWFESEKGSKELECECGCKVFRLQGQVSVREGGSEFSPQYECKRCGMLYNIYGQQLQTDKAMNFAQYIHSKGIKG